MIVNYSDDLNLRYFFQINFFIVLARRWCLITKDQPERVDQIDGEMPFPFPPEFMPSVRLMLRY